MKKFLTPLYAITLSISMVGCIGTDSGTSTSNEPLTRNTVATINLNGASLQQIPIEDLGGNVKASVCSYNAINPLILCSKDNSFCAKLTACPQAQYTHGVGGVNYWVQNENNETGGILKLTFNKTVSPTLHLTDIYNELLGNGAVGQIKQIDMRACNTLIKGGAGAGTSCAIDFVYSGIAMNMLKNNIHLIFNSTNPDQSLDFNFSIQNNYFTNQNVGVLNPAIDQQVIYNNNSVTENSDNSSLEYSPYFRQILQNNGVGDINSIQGNQTIKVTLGSKFNVESLPLYSTNGNNTTTCGNNSVISNGICEFDYYAKEVFNLNYNGTHRFGFAYSNDGVSPAITDTKYVALSIGDLIPQEFSSDTLNPVFYVGKQNYGNPLLTYNLPLKNFQLTPDYDELFPISTSVAGNRLLYAYGDYNDKPLKEIVSSISLSYDPKCFSNGYDINKSIRPDSDQCKVVPILNNNNFGEKPLQFQLYASYYSPVGTNLHQRIGNVLLSHNNPTVNAGLCTSVWWNKNTVNCTYKTKYWSGYDSVDGSETLQFDYASCGANSSVEQRIVQVPIYGPHGSWEPPHGYYYKPELYCNPAQDTQPTGSYKNSCSNISWDNAVLSATCKNSADEDVNSVLYYTDDCSANSQVDNIEGSLRCTAYPQPKGNYLDSCSEINWDGQTLSAKCDIVPGYHPNINTLKYVEECAKDSKVTNVKGILTCDFLK